MTTTQACGTGFGVALVVVATGLAVWHTEYVRNLCLWLGSRGDPARYRYPFPKIWRGRA